MNSNTAPISELEKFEYQKKQEEEPEKYEEIKHRED